MQINEFKAEVIRNGLTLEELATRIGINRKTLWRRLNNPKSFTLEEIRQITQLLNLDSEKVIKIFFPQKVS